MSRNVEEEASNLNHSLSSIHPEKYEDSIPLELPNGQLNPLYIENAFQTLIATLEKNYNRHPGRFPVRIQRIRDAFHGRETEFVPLDEIVQNFKLTTSRPEYASLSAISALNKIFRELNIGLEIERVSAYRIVKRKI